MKLEAFISQYNIDQILDIEHSDPQFLALKKAWQNLSNSFDITDFDKNLFLYLILQNSLVSYQIAWWGEFRRKEFADKVTKDFGMLKKIFKSWKSNIDWRYDFLVTSKYNKRIYNIKISRLKKFENFLELKCLFQSNYFVLYNNMQLLLELISKIMKTKKESKTLVFAIKMFWYGARIVYDEFIMYPNDIPIPVDSRLKKIYEKQFEKIDLEHHIQQYFSSLSSDLGVPPLHLDSLIWLSYRNKFMK